MSFRLVFIEIDFFVCLFVASFCWIGNLSCFYSFFCFCWGGFFLGTSFFFLLLLLSLVEWQVVGFVSMKHPSLP